MRRLLFITFAFTYLVSCDFLLSESELLKENYFINYENVIGPKGDTLNLFKDYPIPSEEVDFEEWVSQFKKLSESKTVYNYYSDPIDWKGPVVNRTTHYENGIVVDYFSMYESISVEVKLPFIERDQAINLFNKINIDDLSYGQRNIIFTKNNFGVAVEFGGGL